MKKEIMKEVTRLHTLRSYIQLKLDNILEGRLLTNDLIIRYYNDLCIIDKRLLDIRNENIKRIFKNGAKGI